MAEPRTEWGQEVVAKVDRLAETITQSDSKRDVVNNSVGWLKWLMGFTLAGVLTSTYFNWDAGKQAAANRELIGAVDRSVGEAKDWIKDLRDFVAEEVRKVHDRAIKHESSIESLDERIAKVNSALVGLAEKIDQAATRVDANQAAIDESLNNITDTSLPVITGDLKELRIRIDKLAVEETRTTVAVQRPPIGPNTRGRLRFDNRTRRAWPCRINGISWIVQRGVTSISVPYGPVELVVGDDVAVKKLTEGDWHFSGSEYQINIVFRPQRESAAPSLLRSGVSGASVGSQKAP